MLDSIKGELRVYTREVGKGKSVRIFFNGCVGYSYNEEDEEYINYYMQIDFSKAVKKDVAKVYKNEFFDILIKDSWIKCYRNKDGNIIPVLFVNKATIVEDEEKTKKSSAKKSTKKATTKKSTKKTDETEDEEDEDIEPLEVDDDELPF